MTGGRFCTSTSPPSHQQLDRAAAKRSVSLRTSLEIPALRSRCLEVFAAIRSLQIAGVRASMRNPWQNGVSERWVENCRCGLLDHIIAVSKRHLKRLLADYLRYYNCASYCPPRYVVENSKPFCCDVGIARSRLLRRTRSTNLAAASVSSAR